MTEAVPRLALRGIWKRFGEVTALAPLTLDLPSGTIHGILGENGAGKSTLVRIIGGALRADGGTVLTDGRPVASGNARAARGAGIGVVYQHFALIGALSVAENLFLGRPEAAQHIVSPRRLADEARQLAQSWNLDIGDANRRCDELPVGSRARLEILRALSGGPTALVLDEPTAVLTPHEIEELFATLRRLRSEGLLVVFITHKLEEAVALCDTVSILRGGRLIATLPAHGQSVRELASLMVGAGTPDGATGAAPGAQDEATARQRWSERAGRGHGEAAALAVRKLGTPAGTGRVPLSDVDLSVMPGEICGVAGVDGNGQHELAEALFGLAERSGAVSVAGAVVPPRDVAAAQRAGMALIPGDRRRHGLALGLPIWENALLAAPLLEAHAPHGVLDRRRARVLASRLVVDFRVVHASLEQRVGTLSGGNQQRLVIGRALALDPRALVAVNPTRGLDIAATAQVLAAIVDAAVRGVGVLILSTDLDELLTICDRVLVLYRGRITGPVDPSDRARLGALMAGVAA